MGVGILGVQDAVPLPLDLSMPAFGAIRPSSVSAMTNPDMRPTMRFDSRRTSSARAWLIEYSDDKAVASS